MFEYFPNGRVLQPHAAEKVKVVGRRSKHLRGTDTYGIVSEDSARCERERMRGAHKVGCFLAA